MCSGVRTNYRRCLLWMSLGMIGTLHCGGGVGTHTAENHRSTVEAIVFLFEGGGHEDTTQKRDDSRCRSAWS